jgi:hypothetical protein
MMRIARIAALQYHFDAAEHLPRGPGVNDFASGHFHLDPQVAFNSGYRINDDSLSHMIASISDGK